MTIPRFLFATTLLACAAAPLAGQIKTFTGSEDRKLTRIFYYTQKDGFKPEGQISIGYGSPTWKKSYEDKEQFDKTTRGHRWRLGAGMWTRLDTNVDLDIAGTKIKPGGYYLLLERTTDDKMNLLIVDPATRKKKIDAFQADMVKQATRVAMQWSDGQETTKNLSIKLTPGAEDPSKVAMEVRWGPHKLTLKMVATL